MSTWIAERTLVIRERDSGRQRQVILRVGAPTESGAAGSCAVEITGLLENIKPVMGVDRLQALLEACRFLDNYLEAMSDKLEVFWPTGDPYSRMS